MNAGPIVRPNGKPYRPRTPVRTILLDGPDGETSVVVRGVLDLDEGERIGVAALVAEGALDPDLDPDDVVVIESAWWREIPWCDCGAGHARHVIKASGDARGSWPGVMVSIP